MESRLAISYNLTVRKWPSLCLEGKLAKYIAKFFASYCYSLVLLTAKKKPPHCHSA
jgi:hypothetical protein